MTMPFEVRLFIDNEYVSSSSGETLEVRNAFDSSVFSSNVQVAGQPDVDRAVACAQRAFESWRWTDSKTRCTTMLRCAELLAAHAADTAKLESLCMGCPIALAQRVAEHMSSSFRFYAGFIDKIHGSTYEEDGNGFFKMTVRQPLGVCAAISGWNATPIFAGLKIATAVAAGNTVVFKSSEHSPLGMLPLGTVFKEAGFPPGVINLLSGGPATGAMLSAHHGIAKISFTGSQVAGRQVQMAAAQSNLKQVQLELGGKSASIVFADADFNNAILQNSRNFLLNNAQVCCAGSRLLVQESIADEFVAALKAAFVKLAAATGDPSEPTTFMGPLANSYQAAKVRRYICDAQAQGITVLAGGIDGKETPSGASFVPPTLFFDPPVSSNVYSEEMFGPVLVVKTFKTEEDAVSMANSSSFGLAATVFTSSMPRALRLARQLESGLLSVNSAHMPLVQMPWGGWKQSGYGREGGEEGLLEYMQTKSVHINMNVG